MSSHCMGTAILPGLPVWPAVLGANRPPASVLAAPNEDLELSTDAVGYGNPAIPFYSDTSQGDGQRER